MTFTNIRRVLSRNGNGKGYELLRFCNRIGVNVVGGASKLLKRFLKDIDPEYIVSYSDRTWATGNMYEKIGFKFSHTTKPNYWYVNGGIRENRLKYQKHKLVNLGYDRDKTEKEITSEMGLDRIYGCGNDVYEIVLIK